MTVLELLSPRERQVYCRRIFMARNCDIAVELGASAGCVAMLYRNAKSRIARWEPARQTVDIDLSRKNVARENSLSREPRCTRCFLRGHVVGDPERCLRPARFYALHSLVVD